MISWPLGSILKKQLANGEREMLSSRCASSLRLSMSMIEACKNSPTVSTLHTTSSSDEPRWLEESLAVKLIPL